ncbi:MAG: hypothetical protein AVDCRST_MAG50-1580 [uncultured Acidimicrobiales bacterium]|uniref:Uncharacterized protein n=1 Tax=uncultured Acidimicrobiales bacterium TaxID=310071 RepID=A0A6J4HM78_9ACTN|nr:MAG: hypothetical protein AVDCRST_MAG50-1580 [uncultured Acidimicrobiales bacterium]
MAQTTASRTGLGAAIRAISRIRVVTGGLALLLAWVLASVALDEPGQFDGLVRAAGYGGVAATAIGVVTAAAHWSVVAAAALGVALATTWYGGVVSGSVRVALFGIGLLLLAELIGWSAEAREETFPDSGWQPRAVVLLLLIGGCLVASGLVLGILSMPVPEDLVLAAIGIGAVVLVVGTLLTRSQAAATAVAPRGGSAETDPPEA